MEKQNAVLLEAERFENYGGWVVDQQFMDVMGSPYLLAHGLGVPVKDASTKLQLPQKGQYHIWIRTYNWVAPWNAKQAPGQFQVWLENHPLSPIFGTEGTQWQWQDGGIQDMQNTEVEVRLHDLTGFEGRCDAILFTMDLNQTPPNTLPELKALRQKLNPNSQQIKDGGEFDLIVVGAGIAGICTALTAARLGCRVALIHDRPVIGGNNSSEVRVWLGGEIKKEPYPQIGDVVNEIEPKQRAHHGPENNGEIYEDTHKLALLQQEHVTIFLNYHVNQVETAANTIQAVVAENIQDGTRIRWQGRWFADCSGDATVGYLAGAHFEITTEGHLGQSNLWNVVDTGTPQPFPRCPWAFDLSQKPFPGRLSPKKQPKDLNHVLTRLGIWSWESGFSHDPILEDERNRDNNWLAMYGAWDSLKNVDHLFPTYKLNWAAYISGRRESRRLLGDIILDVKMLKKKVKFSDGCVPTGWDIDIHRPHKEFQKGFKNNEFIAQAQHTNYSRPFWIPYRALYSRNIENLFMAGRNISVTHEALGSVRVMRTGGMMGEVIGMAAALCKNHGVNPRKIYETYWDEMRQLMTHGVGKKQE